MGKRPGKGLNYFLFNNKTGEFHPMEDGYVCGREGDLRFPKDDLMSRRHFQLFVRGNDLYIQDLNSTNKTIVNSVPIMPNKRRRIHLHDVIEAGDQRFILTSQNKYEPANLKDMSAQTGKYYKALPAEEGYLVDGLSEQQTKRTMVLLSAGKFRALRFKSGFQRQKKKIQVIAFTAVIAAIWFALYTYVLTLDGLEELVQSVQSDVIFQTLPIAIGSTILGAIIYSLLLRFEPKKRLTRFLIQLGVLVFVLLSAFLAGIYLDLTDDLQAMITRSQELSAPKSPASGRL